MLGYPETRGGEGRGGIGRQTGPSCRTEDTHSTEALVLEL